MIDEKTAIQWAKDAGFNKHTSLNNPTWFAREQEIQTLITRVKNEAFEEAAKRADAFVYMSANFETFAKEIRELKQELPK